MNTADSANNEKIAELLLKWEEAWEHGEDIPASRLCSDDSDLATELQRRIDRLKKMAWMAEDQGRNEETVPAADPRVGTSLNHRYRLDAVIGEGGFGRVYRAFDLELHRHVAVKLSTRISSQRAQESLIEEARRAAKLRHPGIVPVHDVGREGTAVYFVTDLIDGRSLAEVICTSSPSLPDAVRIIADLAEALHHAHELGFVHRDIKPANILIDSQGRPLITDFGLAADQEQVTRGEDARSGTLPYMAPEQVAGEVQLVGPCSDLYSLGVVLYELLTGQLPHQARTPTALREQILFRQPASVRSLKPVVSPQLEEVCQRLLAKHPADRIADAAKLARTLRSVPTRTRRRLHRGVLIIALVTVVFVAVFVLGRVFEPVSTREPTAAVEPDTEAGVFVFDGSNRIVTPLERFAPCTLEAWVQPKFYPRQDCQFVIGSDIPTKHGIGMAMCEAVLSTEYIAGMFHSQGAIPLDRWSHVAVVFGESETRLFLNGHLVGTGPVTRAEGGTSFVIGNVGKDNPINYWVGKVRRVRISRGERYAGNFVPEGKFIKDADAAPSKAVLIYDGADADGDRVIDLSGAGNNGMWERARP